ncbi:helix-turn-helix protein [Hydrogenoanaerobacterium saccharovorans]|uniref:Helix-turn-helix domain-containing protein n=1 Tax=Hydrogenoanaerobacterium saccharovorans TaxID=474960 RepID=A0A1H7ZCD6_9FIRM|nr:PocR ligand-binding domain-containing protein [Hydrogenoanaerobacterium saccharovorans]RPF48735.1 helix-turn-helix protein [Hydrogenoanaerobacterium saccharovorans]SEM55169.1 Helix-turn-helix domain-containing protein [Hydrogenoanaerobacterium saccharovorans]
MPQIFEEPISRFDLALAKECADAFSLSTGIGCTVSDLNGNVLHSIGYSCSCCEVCSIINEKKDAELKCKDALLYGMMQAERFGGKYIYYCPMGLTCFVSPIMSENEGVALVTAGPLLMVETDDYINFDLNNLKLSNKKIEKVLSVIHNIPYVSPERVSRMSTLLFMSVGFLNNIASYNQLLKTQNSDTIQGQVGDFVHQLKLENNKDASSYPLNKEHELMQSIIDSDKPNSQRLLNELLGHIFFSSGGDFKIIKTRVYELIVLLSRAAIDGGAETSLVFDMNHRYMGEIERIISVDELCYWLSTVMSRYTDLVFKFSDVKHIDVIRKAAEYIRKNYAGKITLEEVASYVYLSPSYFSKVFKEEMDCNFNTYLNKIRIEKSKKLLLTDKIKLVDISGIVGFEDQSYFSKVFKKMTGITPGKYRESRGLIKPKKAN